MPYQPIACDLHDYLEIACMQQYRLRIELCDGSHLEAQALTTETTADKEEFLIVEHAAGTTHLRLDQILAITPLNEDARFGRVRFTGDAPSSSK